MDAAVRGISVPIFFSTDKPSRHGFIELYFSPNAVKPDKATASSVLAWQKADQLYREHHIYGDHQFLVPVRSESIPYALAPPSYLTVGMPLQNMQIGKDPSTAVSTRALQLMPCSHSNLELIKALQREPFYIEIGKRSFSLHVWDQGEYFKIPSQRHAPTRDVPRSVLGRPHPVICLESENGMSEIIYLQDIPWAMLAQQLGTRVTGQSGNSPVFHKYQ